MSGEGAAAGRRGAKMGDWAVAENSSAPPLVEPRERSSQPFAFLADSPVNLCPRQRRQAIKQAEPCGDGEIEEAIRRFAHHRRPGFNLACPTQAPEARRSRILSAPTRVAPRRHLDRASSLEGKPLLARHRRRALGSAGWQLAKCRGWKPSRKPKHHITRNYGARSFRPRSGRPCPASAV